MRMSIKKVLFLTSVVILLLIAILTGKTAINNSKQLNVIIISVDTLRPDHMGTYGYSKNTTPNIDAWAKNAKIFTNAYTIVPETEQSFYTLFTGTGYFLDNRLGTLTAVL